MDSAIKEKAKSLRSLGKTYAEIRTSLGKNIPKSTLSYWCRGIKLPIHQLNRIERKIAAAGSRGLAIAHARQRIHRASYIKSLLQKNSHLGTLVHNDPHCAKAVLASLYLAEGGKNRKGSLMFGNSNPKIIRLFLSLLRRVYDIDNSKFRCTLLCRDDQDILKLQSFWSLQTGITKKQFYAPRIDSRTIGKKSRNKEYKGVCRIDYFSAEVYNDLLAAGESLINSKIGPIV